MARVWRRFALSATVLTLVCGALYLYAFSLFALIEQTKRDNQAAVAIESASEHAGADLQAVLADLRFLGMSVPVQRFLQGEEDGTREEVEQLFVDLAAAHGLYDQVRLLSPEGQELVRINFNNGYPRAMAPVQLQNKSARYYFKDAAAIAGDGIYASRLDLNIEHGVIEQPYKPMIRFAMPLRSRQNRLLGVLVLNYLGDRFLSHIRAHLAPLAGESMLLNREGYWLISSERAREWGFMFAHTETFAELHPEVWAQIEERGHGVAVQGGERFVFATLHPLEVGQVSRGAPHALKDWHIVTVRGNEGLSLAYVRDNLGHLYPLLVFYPLALVLLWFWVRASTGRQLAEEQLVAVNGSLEQQVLWRTEELRATQDATIMTLASLTEQRDNETGQHIRRTQNYIRVLAQELAEHPDFQQALTPEAISMICKSAPLHDIGKVAISDAILHKAGRLTPAELEEMKRHTLYGSDALDEAIRSLTSVPVAAENGTFLHYARDIARYHHERWDGAGYPEGLAGDAIPLAARLMAIADVYDALVSVRVYKPGLTRAVVEQIMLEQSEGQFDPRLLAAFARCAEQFWAIRTRYADQGHAGVVDSPE